MAKNLVLVESPSKARTINKYLGKDYKVEATVGHIRNLPKTKLGVDIDKDFHNGRKESSTTVKRNEDFLISNNSHRQ